MYQNFRLMAALVFIVLCFTARASAQFEVSPDHFDAAPAHVQKKVLHAKTVRGTVAARKPTAGVGTRKKQLAKSKTPAAQQNISAQTRNPTRHQ